MEMGIVEEEDEEEESTDPIGDVVIEVAQSDELVGNNIVASTNDASDLPPSS